MRLVVTMEVQERRDGRWCDDLTPALYGAGGPLGLALGALTRQEWDGRWHLVGERGRDGARRVRVTVVGEDQAASPVPS